MKLFHRKYGSGGPALIIVHGLYGSGDNWAGIARELASDFEVYVIDQRNHGQSPHSDAHDYPSMRDDLKQFMDAEGLDEAVLLGHSMGAKTVMYFAAAWPSRVRSLIAVDMAPRDYNERALESHFAANHARMMDAMLALDLDKMLSREDIDRALAQSGAVGSERIRAFLLKNVRRLPGGGALSNVSGDSPGGSRFVWRLNLPVLRERLPRIMEGLEGEVETSGLKKLPALFVAGANSDYIRPADYALIRSYFPAAQIVSIPGAGHWVHAEQPALLLKNLKYFLEV